MGTKKLNSVQATWDEYGGWIILLVVGYVLWSIRGVFSSFGEAASSAAAAATADVTAKAKTSAAKSSVKAATASTREPSDAEIAKWSADAATFYALLDAGSSLSLSRQEDQAFHMLKTEYSRLNLYNNKPCKWADKTHKKLVSQSVETSESIKNAVNWKVLIPFYKEVSNGRDLRKDIYLYLPHPKYKALLRWIM